MDINCSGFTFTSDFDSGNLARVEEVARKEQGGPNNNDVPDFEFNIWTSPDCAGTEFENGNRSWFHFGIKGGPPFALVKLNIVNLNRQSKMYSQGMAPVFRTVPGRSQWERIRDKPTYTNEDNVFILSFKYRTLENIKAITYFAFTYPYSYSDLQTNLESIDTKMSKIAEARGEPKADDIYYHREAAAYTLEGRRVDLLTISSHHGITNVREPRLSNLFLDFNVPRPFIFNDKKVIFLSARVHPGETPSSFVLNGFLNMLISKDDPISCALRRLYVFKLIPMLNPDGVYRGHYRTDTRGVNLNRVYNDPSVLYHPSVYAARAIIRYHHHRCELPDEFEQEWIDEGQISDRVSVLSLERDQQVCSSSPSSDDPLTIVNNNNYDFIELNLEDSSGQRSSFISTPELERRQLELDDGLGKENDPLLQGDCRGSNNRTPLPAASNTKTKPSDSGLFLYMDFHGHASKKGIFMYGNHFDTTLENVECMLLPKLMALNNQNFHFSACNFTEKNMYLRDKHGGMTREGSGRVAVLKATGLIRSYTLECNYNMGRMVNILPLPVRENSERRNSPLLVPPKYTPFIFEEVGRGLGGAILDLTSSNPCTRLPNSEFRSLNGVRDWLKTHPLSTDHFVGPVQRAAMKLKNSHQKGKVRPPRSDLFEPPPITVIERISRETCPVINTVNIEDEPSGTCVKGDQDDEIDRMISNPDIIQRNEEILKYLIVQSARSKHETEDTVLVPNGSNVELSEPLLLPDQIKPNPFIRISSNTCSINSTVNKEENSGNWSYIQSDQYDEIEVENTSQGSNVEQNEQDALTDGDQPKPFSVKPTTTQITMPVSSVRVHRLAPLDSKQTERKEYASSAGKQLIKSRTGTPASNVFQVRAKCAAINAMASGSKTNSLRKIRNLREDIVKKDPKRIKISEDTKNKIWNNGNRVENIFFTWRTIGRLEKKIGGESVRRHLTPDQRRKKSKAK